MSRRRRIALVAAGLFALGVAALIASGRFPARPLLTFLQFKLNPEKARVQHLVQLRHPQTGQVVFLAGTTHQYHYEDPAYSIWHVKAIVTGLDVDAVLVEMMPEAIDEGRFGDGPVEMPFIALVAKDAGIDVAGMDSGWDGGWRGRQDRMFEHVLRHLPLHRRLLITSGFMHVRQFEEQLQKVGFVVVPWSEAERQQIFLRKVEEAWPKALAPALRAAMARARAGTLQTDPEHSADMSWFIQVREQVLRAMGEPIDGPTTPP